MQLLIFDLDGTLIDSQRDLANSVNATRAHLGMPPLPDETIYSYVGNGAPVLIKRSLGPEVSEATLAGGLEFFLAHYFDHLLDNTVLYPGVREALDCFRDRGIPMAVLTNKPLRATQTILDGLDLHDHFFRVYGGNSFEQKKPDPVGIVRLLEESGASRDKALMIGDSAIDIRTARNAGVGAVGVTYGFQPETLRAEPPDFLLDSMQDLIPIVLPPATGAPQP